MAYQLPPVHLLTIFEAAARHESFKDAGEELFITPSAVSHQIKALEEYLGFELFQRKSRGVEINQAGRVYLQDIQKGLSTIEQGTKKIRHRFATPTLKISCFTTLASNIIIPQISDFQLAHPEIDIRIETGNQLADLRYDDVDLAIRVGSGDWPNVVVEKITDLEIAAVGSQEFIDKHKIKTPSDVSDVPLIDLTYMDDIWGHWSSTMSVELTSGKRAISFSDYNAAISAASQGVGLALAMFPLENIQEKRKAIVRPFGEKLPFSNSLYAVYRKEESNRHDIHCFLKWLKKSAPLKEAS
ncbi:LysR family transcriptional regulator [Alteromonadaceae bacterium M269]|nr:LysR family transcriptional regulator [Alteromonadaceae bacterium M269]